ncbi:MAG: MmcQ/YjbR family DNA-binding protein [Bacteroidia bacterium]|nr:MmcQ/YjbR family DNA-binding protein [Bacteroidia bacterium]
MHIEQLREYCLAKKGVEETFPFGEDTLVFKVMGKMFAVTSLSEPVSVNLKCNPEKAIELRASFEAVKPGYHMNKIHWNTISYNEDVSDKLILELIDHSYQLVVSSLTKKLQQELNSL